MGSREVLKRLRAAGWRQVNQEGSHVQLKHEALPGRVTMPHPSRNTPIGTLKSIERQSGVALV